ncbi:glycosyltransferase [Virgibacillus sp. 179-BFC.A HS]|uniref:Glycosyltransferase n=1 Tax=Tigheibacillus jepli TaxID=3035914 RepID=A0ABU5CJM6_9BACI|nr:glycosyltransferase [Virgibacillus sp. 179-BFC.A HS]MDY0406548.1 glycosyltransferase [Virgibacillus sp. 179-BFC.A HS]
MIFYSILTIACVWYRSKERTSIKLATYPSVVVLIPAHNEDVVIEDTLRAMARLQYPGKLDIFLLDDNSVDRTAEIGQAFSRVFSHIHCIPVPKGEPKGKSRVLNYGLKISDSEYFVVYDADNQPEPDALRKLVEAAESTPNTAGAVGCVRTKNMHRNYLTRMIGLEFQVFQLLMQCGRWALFKLGSLAGTNMLLKRSVIREVGGYDEYALAEDADLTMRITALGYRLPVVSNSYTWEQEPETIKTFLKQRTRWLIGNIYMLGKSLHDFSYWKGKTFVLTLHYQMTYAVFVMLLLVSDVFFLIGLFGHVFAISMHTPFLFLWFMSYIVYTSQLLSAIVMDRNVSVKNVCFLLMMYFTYAQLFIVLLVRGYSIFFWNKLRKQTIGWDKTARFRSKPE